MTVSNLGDSVQELCTSISAGAAKALQDLLGWGGAPMKRTSYHLDSCCGSWDPNKLSPVVPLQSCSCISHLRTSMSQWYTDAAVTRPSCVADIHFQYSTGSGI